MRYRELLKNHVCSIFNLSASSCCPYYLGYTSKGQYQVAGCLFKLTEGMLIFPSVLLVYNRFFHACLNVLSASHSVAPV